VWVEGSHKGVGTVTEIESRKSRERFGRRNTHSVSLFFFIFMETDCGILSEEAETERGILSEEAETERGIRFGGFLSFSSKRIVKSILACDYVINVVECN